MSVEKPRRDPVKARVAELRKLLRLSEAETDLLVFLHLFYSDRCDWFRGLATEPFPSTRIKPALHKLFGMVTGSSATTVAPSAASFLTIAACRL